MTGEGGAVGVDQLKGKYGNPSMPLLKTTISNKGADLACRLKTCVVARLTATFGSIQDSFVLRIGM